MYLYLFVFDNILRAILLCFAESLVNFFTLFRRPVAMPMIKKRRVQTNDVKVRCASQSRSRQFYERELTLNSNNDQKKEYNDNVQLSAGILGARRLFGAFSGLSQSRRAAPYPLEIILNSSL